MLIIFLQKRATVRTQDYFYHPISNTPFTLGIALPRDYGKYRVKGEVEVSLAKFNISHLFTGNDWRLHPDWVYCEYNYAGTPMREFDTPEKNMEHFFKRMQEPSWTWGTPNVLPLPKCSNKEKFEPNCMKCKIPRFLIVYCVCVLLHIRLKCGKKCNFFWKLLLHYFFSIFSHCVLTM